MKLKSTLLAMVFAIAHFGLVAPFVPLVNILPAGLGALAISSMSLSLILAARWRIVDRLMGGPDKSYVLHRYFGFFAVIGTLGHWALASSVGTGIFPVLAESGGEVGNLAAFGLLAMTAAAAVRILPYHIWKLSHMLMGPIFILAVYHTFVVASPLALGSVPWVVLAGMSGLGILAWVQTLLRKRSPTRLMTVTQVTPFDGGIDVLLHSDTSLPKFRAGQFATLADNLAGAEAHPFTIGGGDKNTRRFVIRSAGDWTDKFVSTVKLGDQLRVGRGEGRFLPQTGDKRKQQLWIAGGVGITPFLAALEQMQPDHGATVTLIYCIRARNSAGAVDDIERHAERLPQLDLIVLTDDKTDGLTSGRLEEILRGFPDDAQAYLCGPEGLKTLAANAWEIIGMKGKIHSERFDFRGAYGLTDLIYIGKPVLDTARNVAAYAMRRKNAPVGS